MVKSKLKLKDFVEDQTFIDNMNNAFSDLRADYELSMDVDKSKISELKKVHIDNRNYLSDLQSYSRKSSGVVSGLRGTGKTHLFLLAREEINSNIQDDKSLCIYLNAKRLYIPKDANQELFNRIFSVFIYNEISNQLIDILKQSLDLSRWERFKNLFRNNDSGKSISTILIKLANFKSIAYHGNEEFTDLDKGNISRDDFNKELVSIQGRIKTELGSKGVTLDSEISEIITKELSEGTGKTNTYQRYLNIESVRKQIIELLTILNLDSITFYVDEWEKLYHRPINQEYLSFYIDRVIDTPIYFWIGVVPYRGGLYYLDNGSDLQHYINLDESLVFENSDDDRKLCINYFKEFINKRLFLMFANQNFNYNLLFNDDKKIEQLILASMGNSRDFGTMLLNCWSEYKSYRTSKLTQGRPFSFINQHMVVKAIKNNGDKKLSNIKDNDNILAVWRDLETYCISKNSSHFAIEETNENMEYLNCVEFSELIYHRLLHFRKGHVPPKDINIINKLSIYALNYTSIFDLLSKDRKILFVTEYKLIHDRVRRYLYNPKTVIDRIRINEGQVFPCNSCGERIYINIMIGAWNNNSCPFCGNHIRN